MKGLVISAPASGAGKTTLTLGLLAALRARGHSVQPFKSGPDYIDPAFHYAAAGRPSYNLDSWSMERDLIDALVAKGVGADLAVVEGSMGLFDGVAEPGAFGTGASADIAALTGWPVILVIDASGQAQSAAAVALGHAQFRPDVSLAGVVLNRVASPRHERLARAGLEQVGIPCFGALPRAAMVTLPERHLGLVQAEEIPELDATLSDASTLIETHCDIEAMLSAAVLRDDAGTHATHIRPPAQRIALARDAAFSFVYPHLLEGWRAAGAEILPFSPLADEGPDPSADLCWLPGGYPELHADKLSAANGFKTGMRQFANTRPVHGECGGYMVLGAGIEDRDGTRHAMLGLLGLETSFAKRKMHLGYRFATVTKGPRLGQTLRGHEFHYATILAEPDTPLANISDASGTTMPETGSLRSQAGGGTTSGTFFHLITETS